MALFKNNVDAIKDYLSTNINNPETLRLNFFEKTPVKKKIYELKTDKIPVAFTKLVYSLGSSNMNSNGFIQLTLSKLDNPDVFGTSSDNSQILFDILLNATYSKTDVINFENPILLKDGEILYIYLYSNLPNSDYALGKLSFYYLPMVR